MNYRMSFMSLLLLFWLTSFSQTVTEKKLPNSIIFEKTNYGLIFTNILVNGKEVKAMIDFGDQHYLQLSSTLVGRLGLAIEPAGYQVADVYGNTYDVNQGTLNKLKVGNWQNESVEFTSQAGEMESVSEQIGTEFNAVVGWGYFKEYFTLH